MALLIKFCVFAIVVLAMPRSFALTSQEAIDQLKDIQKNNRLALEKADKAVQEQIKHSREITVKDLSRNDHEVKFRAIEDAVIGLQEKREEFIKRGDFINQLISKFAASYHGQNLKDYLEENLLEMVATELGVGSHMTNTDPDFWRFLLYTSVVIREMPEQIENLFKVLETYMNFSTVLNPKSPGEFRAQRNYFNGQSAESGSPLSADKIDEGN
jgi:hypothetical protein